MHQAERDALTRAAERDERLNFLARGTDILAASQDYENALRQIADLAVRRFADWCIFDIGDEAEALSRRVVAHAEPMPADHPLATGPSRFVMEDRAWKHVFAPPGAPAA